jgi:phage terminase small subunit
MGEHDAGLFRELVGSVDADHFRAGDVPLLRQYVEAIRLAEEAGDALRRDGAVIGGRASPWLVVSEKAQRSMVALSMRLRLSPQSRLHARTAARKPGAISAYEEMMDNE